MAALGAKIGTAYVDVQGDFTSLNRGVDQSTKAAGGKVKGLGKTITGAIGGIGAFYALKVGVGAMVSEFEEARKVGAQTNAVLKSTGGAAGVTAKDVEKLAGSISKKAGIDDEAIQSGENLLLTFTKVRNEAGKGNDVFNQATRVATDMSVALGQDMKSSAIQLGKALNDPIKGVTALQRVGVSFTASQKEQIKTLVASGDTLGAQKLILKELNTEFGGSAAAAATPIDKLKVSLGNLAEKGGSLLVPMFDKLSVVLTKVIDFTTRYGSVIGPVVAVIATFAAVLKGAAIAQALLNAVMVANPIGLVIAAIAALVVGLIVAWKHSETFRDIVTGTWNALRATGEAVFGAITATISTAWNVVRTVTETVWSAIKLVVTTYIAAVKLILTTYFDAIVTVIRTAWTVARTVTTTIVGAIRDVVLGAWRAIRDTGKAIWDGIVAALGAVWAGIKASASLAWDAIRLVIVTPLREARNVIQDIVRGLRDWLADRWGDIKDAAGKLATPFRAAFDRMASGVESVWNWLKKVKDLVGDVIDAIGKIKLPHIKVPDLNPFNGGEGGGNVGPTAPLTGGVDQFNPVAKGFGLTMTSAYRPGDPGWHGKNRARDYSNGTDTPQELAFAKYMAASYGKRLLELIHTPLGYGIKNGVKVPLSFWGSAVNAAHHNHVHVAYRMGGKSTMPEFARVGEDAPRWPEYHIATNPAYRGQNIALMQQAASDLNLAPAGGMGIPNITVYLGDREITDIVRVEVDESDRRKGAAYMAGVN